MKWAGHLVVGVCLLLLVTALLNNVRWAYYENGRYCLDRWTGIRYAVTDKAHGEHVGGNVVSKSEGMWDLTRPAWDFTKPAGAPSDYRVVYERPNPFLDTAKYVFGSAGALAAFGFAVRFTTAWRDTRGNRTP